MKKVLLGLLIVLSVLICFVSCEDEPKEEPKVDSVSFKKSEDSDTFIFVFNRGGSGSYTEILYGGEATDLFQSTFEFTTENTLCVKYEKQNKTNKHIFYEGEDLTKPISNFDELVELTTIYEWNLCEFIPYSKETK